MKPICLLAGLYMFLVGVPIAFTQVKEDLPKSNLPSYEEVTNRVRTLGESNFRVREIYVFLREEAFTLEAFTKILDKVQSENCDPQALVITIMSNRGQLLKRSRVDELQTVIHFADDERGKVARAEYYAKLYPTSGFYEVVYDRNRNYELIDYDLEKEAGGSKRIFIIAPKGTIKNGETSSDLRFSSCKEN